MQAALMLRSKSRVARRRKLRKLGGRLELPSNVATKEIAPFPRYPPESWKNTYVTTPPAPPQPPPPPPECAQGRAAWLERGRRCSVQDQQQQQATCHRRWVKRNRIQDASLGGSSDDEDFLGVLRGPSTFANAFLYVGLGTVALGLVIAFVGTGEKGFKTTELRLIGPSLIGLGLICCILRILFCICPSHCISSSKKTRKKNGNKIDADHTTSLLRNESKRVSIARGPSFQVPKYPLAHKRSQSKMLNEGMEALRQIATTSLFMQNEQKTAINRVVPIINEPESGDAPLEMKKLQTALNACEMSDDEQDQDQDQQKQQQIAKRTTATTAVTSSTTKDPTSTAATSRITRATTLSTVDEKPDSKLVRQRVALQQQRQQQQQQQQDQQHVPKSQSLSSSSTVKDSLEVVEETSLIDASNETTTPVATTGASSTAPMPSSCSTGAIPRLNRPGISTGATPKTTTTTTTPTITARLPTSQSHPTSYDLPPALPHTYSATATVRGPLGMSMSSSTSGKGMGTAFTLPPTTTTISLLPLPAPSTVATASSTSTTIACIPGQVLETSGVTSLSLSLMRPATASGVVLSGLTTSSFTTGTDHQKSHPSSAGSVMGRGSSLLLSPPTAAAASSSSSSSKFEPELVLSPANLGQ
ncbi:mucin-5AC isoform X3 [Drosophila sechellia]|uniref:mucin-5AC isoform X3 n=1 Tax=Drosophila sechellia TaxID=7238 RepID=UPI0013DDBD5A|nr:mucin-5AC isoform X3 [Drosophila sechellia]